MDKFVITGGSPLKGTVEVAGAKNVAMKVVLAGLLTEEKLTIHNVPFISSVLGTTKIVEPLGVKVIRTNHTLKINGQGLNNYTVPLELGGIYRTAPMTIGPLLARFGRAIVPNPGGCRLGKRPIDWQVNALTQMGAKIEYKDGYYYAEGKLTGAKIKFPKNTHTGTEAVILAAVLAKGETIIENAAEEPEIDELILLLNQMGAKIERNDRVIHIQGVNRLHGATYSVMPDRNEVITYAVAAIATGGNVVVKGTQRYHLQAFLKALGHCGACWEAIDDHSTRFFSANKLKAINIETKPYPGFMTDWQSTWAILMTQAAGESIIHETVFESRFQYVFELRKMGAKIDFFSPDVKNAEKYYNFNLQDKIHGFHQAIKIKGPVKLHEAVVEISDLRAGATLVVAALVAKGKSVLLGIEHIDRGYENFDQQLQKLGAKIKREKIEI